MEQRRYSYGSVWKRRAMKFLAAFFVLYVVLDISVLQAYCCDEEFKLPSISEQLRLKDESSASKPITGEIYSVGVSHFPDRHPSPDAPVSEDGCFCRISHTTLVVNAITTATKRPAGSITAVSNFSDKNLHPDSHPSPHYQPPKFS